MVLTSEKLADLKKKELTSKARRGINAILPFGEETNKSGEIVATSSATSIDLNAKLDKLITLQMNAISKPPPKLGNDLLARPVDPALRLQVGIERT